MTRYRYIYIIIVLALLAACDNSSELKWREVDTLIGIGFIHYYDNEIELARSVLESNIDQLSEWRSSLNDNHGAVLDYAEARMYGLLYRIYIDQGGEAKAAELLSDILDDERLRNNISKIAELKLPPWSDGEDVYLWSITIEDAFKKAHLDFKKNKSVKIRK